MKYSKAKCLRRPGTIRLRLCFFLCRVCVFGNFIPAKFVWVYDAFMSAFFYMCVGMSLLSLYHNIFNDGSFDKLFM